MNEAQLHPNACTVRPNRLTFTVECSLLDEEGNSVQVFPLSCEGICFPFGPNVEGVITQIIDQIQERINANRPQPEPPAPCVPSEAG